MTAAAPLDELLTGMSPAAADMMREVVAFIRRHHDTPGESIDCIYALALGLRFVAAELDPDDTKGIRRLMAAELRQPLRAVDLSWRRILRPDEPHPPTEPDA